MVDLPPDPPDPPRIDEPRAPDPLDRFRHKLHAYARPRLAVEPADDRRVGEIRRWLRSDPMRYGCLLCRGKVEDLMALIGRHDELEKLLASCHEAKAELIQMQREMQDDPDDFVVMEMPPTDDRDGLAFWNAALDVSLRVVESEYARRGGRDLHALIDVITQRLKMQRRVG